MIATVVVRIPPPTELGEAPINMSRLKSNNVIPEKAVTSIVVKPALLVAEDINNNVYKQGFMPALPLKKSFPF